MQKLQNREENSLVQTSQLVGILRDKNQECEEKTDEHYGSSSGCFICFALGMLKWAYHIPE
jgi:hypothetical protein